MIDWSLFLIGLLIPLCGVLAWMYADAERETRLLRIKLEEAELWLLLADEEFDALRRRLAQAEAHTRLRSVRSLPLHRLSREALEEMRN